MEKGAILCLPPLIAPLARSIVPSSRRPGRSPFNPANHPFNANFDLSLYNDCLIVPGMVSSIMFSRLVSLCTKPLAKSLSPFTATLPKNAPVTPLPATHPKLGRCNSFACHTSEKQGVGANLRLTAFLILRKTSRARRQVAAYGGRCHNPASRLQSVFPLGPQVAEHG